MIEDQMKRVVNALERLVELAEVGKTEPESIGEFYMGRSKPLDYFEKEPEHSPKTIREKTMDIYVALGEDRRAEIPELLREMGAVDEKDQVSLKSLDRGKYVDYLHRLNQLVA